MGLLEDISSFPWSDHVTLHVSNEGTRADIHSIMSGYKSGWNVYACGAETYMSAVMDAAKRAGFPEDARHLEYFSVPEIPDYENSVFTIKLLKSKIELTVPANKNAAEVLIENGIPVNLKCSDGLCGVCQCGLVSGEVEHRDFVLSKAQQKNTIITCQSRAAKPEGLLELNL
jgi:ferredoxin